MVLLRYLQGEPCVPLEDVLLMRAQERLTSKRPRPAQGAALFLGLAPLCFGLLTIGDLLMLLGRLLPLPPLLRFLGSTPLGPLGVLLLCVDTSGVTNRRTAATLCVLTALYWI